MPCFAPSWSVCLCSLLAPPSVERTVRSEMRFASSRGTFQLRRLFSIASVTRGTCFAPPPPTIQPLRRQRKRRNHFLRSLPSLMLRSGRCFASLVDADQLQVNADRLHSCSSRRVAPPFSFAVTMSQIPRQTRLDLHAPRSHDASHDRSRSANDLAARRKCARVRQQEATTSPA